MPNNEGDKSGNGQVFKVGIRVPPFWPEEPEIWFAQIEGQFAISGITNDATKFNYVIGQLDNQYSKEVKDVIINPPAADKYEKLKTLLIKRLTTSKEQKPKQLITIEELGDRKPSQFLRHLQGLSDSTFPDDLMRTIWSNRLPNNIQIALASQPSTSTLDDLADYADRVHEIASTTAMVASASKSQPESDVSELTREIAELRRQFRSFSTNTNGRSRSKSRRASRSPMRRSDSNYRKFPVCWYHYKFGDRATNCIRPCEKYRAGNSRGSQ
ncbi:hypothetical protein O0L34_g17798 [Tuta absoluta]|nr:hypothetical protein O0L34_g17798 [Tuta absoluta]